MATTDGAAMRAVLRKLGWFAVFWALGVVVVLALAYAIRLMIL